MASLKVDAEAAENGGRTEVFAHALVEMIDLDGRPAGLLGCRRIRRVSLGEHETPVGVRVSRPHVDVDRQYKPRLIGNRRNDEVGSELEERALQADSELADRQRRTGEVLRPPETEGIPLGHVQGNSATVVRNPESIRADLDFDREVGQLVVVSGASGGIRIRGRLIHRGRRIRWLFPGTAFAEGVCTHAGCIDRVVDQVAVGVWFGEPSPDVPAAVHYARIEGTREKKLARLATIQGSADLDWSDCPADWHAAFLPRTAGDYWSWPLVTDLFPWQPNGIKAGRTWPIDPDPESLRRRWTALVRAEPLDRPALFKNSPTGRDASWRSVGRRLALESIAEMPSTAPTPPIERVAFRSLDRHWLISDTRLLDRESPGLWIADGPRQTYLTSLLTNVLGLGPAAMASAQKPDLHHFRGSFGGKDVVPLWRDAAASESNVTGGLLDLLARELGRPVSPEELFAYAYAVLASPSYVERFSEELTIPGPRIPLTRNRALFAEAVELGRRLIWLHTYGTRFVPDGERPGVVPQGSARAIVAVPDTAADYPERFSYDEPSRTVHVGKGAFGPVAPEVWSFSVSGFEVVRSWLAYRMKDGAGRRSSPLDEIRPERWTPAFTEEFLELLWVLEATVATYPPLESLLGRVVAGPAFAAADLPSPTADERAAPSAPTAPEDQPTLGLD